jgi:cytosine/adenosine deaminase-related metal-dependent hydrolase
MTPPRAASPEATTFVNARLGNGELSSLRIVGGRIAALGEPPHPGDWIVDLKGDRVLPGLINAHDHLQLNNLPSLEPGPRYRHVREWISAIDAHRTANPSFEARVALARDERLLIGGIKNLFSGVTTVAHHDPLYPSLTSANFPVRIVQNYGWCHSLEVNGEQQLRDSYRQTPIEWPWIVHAAEGVEEDARQEFERLEALGCLRPNTLLVHGLALDSTQRQRLADAGAGLIWCPGSNMNLFGRTAQVSDLLARGRLALGSDSRLSGGQDLLEELRIASEVGGLDERTLEALVTCDSARLLRLPDRGTLCPGACADLLILPAGARLTATSRAEVRLVLIEGTVRFGDRDCARAVAPATSWTDIRVDGRAKILDSAVAALLQQSTAREPGLELPDRAWRAA